MSSTNTSLLLELLEYTRRFVPDANNYGRRVITVDRIGLHAYLRDHLRRVDAKLGSFSDKSRSTRRCTRRRRRRVTAKLRVDSPFWTIVPAIDRSRQNWCELARSAYRDIIIARLYAYDIIDDIEDKDKEKEIESAASETDCHLPPPPPPPPSPPPPSSSPRPRPRLLDFAMRTNVALNNGSRRDVTCSRPAASDRGKYAEIVERTIVDTVRRGVDPTVRLHMAIRATESLREEVRQLTERVDREFGTVDRESSADLDRNSSLRSNANIVHLAPFVANNGGGGGGGGGNGDGGKDGGDSERGGGDSDHGCGGNSDNDAGHSENVGGDGNHGGGDSDNGGSGSGRGGGDGGNSHQRTSAEATLPSAIKYNDNRDVSIRLGEFDSAQKQVLMISRERAIMDERVRRLTETVEHLRNALNGTSDTILLAVQQATREMESRLERQEQERQARHKVRMARLHEQIALLKREQTTLRSVRDSVATLAQIGESVRESMRDKIVDLDKASRELEATNDLRERAIVNVEHRVLSIVRSYAHRTYGASVLPPNILDYIHRMSYPRIIDRDALIDMHAQFCLKRCSQLLALGRRRRRSSTVDASSTGTTDAIADRVARGEHDFTRNIFGRANFFAPSTLRQFDDSTNSVNIAAVESSPSDVRRRRRTATATAKSVHLCRDRLVAFLFFYGNIDTIDILRRLIALHEEELRHRATTTTTTTGTTTTTTTGTTGTTTTSPSSVEQQRRRRRDTERITGSVRNNTIKTTTTTWRPLRDERLSIFDNQILMRLTFGSQLVNRTLAYRIFLEEDWSDLTYVPVSVLRYICDAFELRWRSFHRSNSSSSSSSRN